MQIPCQEQPLSTVQPSPEPGNQHRVGAKVLEFDYWLCETYSSDVRRHGFSCNDMEQAFSAGQRSALSPVETKESLEEQDHAALVKARGNLIQLCKTPCFDQGFNAALQYERGRNK